MLRGNSVNMSQQYIFSPIGLKDLFWLADTKLLFLCSEIAETSLVGCMGA